MKKKKIDYYRILAILILLCGITYYYLNIFAPRFIPRTLRVGTMRRPTTLLVVGTDYNYDVNSKERLNVEGRTDSILLVRIDPARFKLTVLSIPRDSFVPIPGHGLQKINAAHVYGGIELLEQTIQALTGIKPDYYLKMNPVGMVKMVDLLGGVIIDVDKDLYYVDHAGGLTINIKHGWRRLSGEQAEEYLRFRHDNEGDIGRIARQQKFMQALFQTISRPSNLLKSPVVLKLANQYLETDLSLADVMRLANFARMLTMNDVTTFTAPGDIGMSDYAGSIWILNQAELDKITHAYFPR
jgi:LCP family protein required for cell wall assembly